MIHSCVTVCLFVVLFSQDCCLRLLESIYYGYCWYWKCNYSCCYGRYYWFSV